MDSTFIVKLFTSVLEKEKTRFNVNNKAIINAVNEIAEAYKPDSNWEENTDNKHINYNKPAYRCAYLHKFAMLHTGLVYEILENAYDVSSIQKKLSQKHLNICCLGGGPGSEVVALIFFLWEMIGLIQCDVSVVDSSLEWRQVFESVISELKTPKYGTSALVADGYFHYQYLKADLLLPLDHDSKVKAVIADADVIFMVKFVSAAASSETEKMIEGILTSMKQDSMLVFIDNAGGGFYEVLSSEAKKCSMKPLLEDFNMRYYKYREPKFDHVLCGSKSRTEITVAVEIWRKSMVRKSSKRTNKIPQDDEVDSPNVRLSEKVPKIPDSSISNEESGWQCCSLL